MPALAAELYAHNSLFDADTADGHLQALGGERALAQLADVLVWHGATDRFGLCLLHRHGALERGERMVGAEASDAHGAYLLMTPRPLSAGSYIPSTWRFIDGCFFATEYAESDLARVHAPDPGLAADLADAMSSLEVSDVVGLWQPPWPFLHALDDDQILLERLLPQERATMARGEPRSAAADPHAVKTGWIVRDGCLDMIGACNAVLGCNLTTDRPGHRREVRHH